MLRRLETESILRKKILILLGIIIVGLIITEIWSVNRLATFGAEIQKVEVAKAKLILENKVLENQIAENSSLVNAEVEIDQMGFKKIKDITFLKQPGLALNN